MAYDNLTYKGYNALIEFYHKEKLYFGRILNIKNEIKFSGNSLPELKRNFESCVDEYIQSNKLRIKDVVIIKNVGGKLNNTTGSILAEYEIGLGLINYIVLLNEPCDENLAAVIPASCLEKVEL